MISVSRLSVATLCFAICATLIGFLLALCHSWSTHSPSVGLTSAIGTWSLALGAILGVIAYRSTPTSASQKPNRVEFVLTIFMSLAFGMYAFRSFLWTIYFDHSSVNIGSPFNIQDITCHILYTLYLASGIALWPPNPMDAWETFQYYPGVDFFQSILTVLGGQIIPIFAGVGLIGAVLTGYALYRWGGPFTMAGFLFNGGFSVYLLFGHRGQLGDVDWKSLSLAVLTTQRGYLVALPAGLLLLSSWRGRWKQALNPLSGPGTGREIDQGFSSSILPFWIELLLYASLPFFQTFTFVYFSLLLGWWFVAGFQQTAMRKHILTLVALALIPATFEMCLVSGGFSAAGNIRFLPGWLQDSSNPLRFWLLNFGISLPICGALWVMLIWKRWFFPTLLGGVGNAQIREKNLEPDAINLASLFVVPAGVIFLISINVMFTAWAWDNIKLMLWSYLIVLPFLWDLWLKRWKPIWRCAVIFLLFISGFGLWLDGLNRQHRIYKLVERDEWVGIEDATKNISPLERFASAPEAAHPLSLAGKSVAMGYAGTLFSYGMDYRKLESYVNALMLGKPGWRTLADRLGVRYVFWGPREEKKYPGSKRPWEMECQCIARGPWGAIYDLQPMESPK